MCARLCARLSNTSHVTEASCWGEISPGDEICGNKNLTKLVKLSVMNKKDTFANMKLPYALRPGMSPERSVRPVNRAGVRSLQAFHVN